MSGSEPAYFLVYLLVYFLARFVAVDRPCL